MNKEAIRMIGELVEQYGDSARQIIIDGLGIESKGSNSYKCPNGHAHKNGDRNPSMGWVTGKNYFKCQGCGETINIYTYYKNYLNYSFSEIMSNNGIAEIENNLGRFKESVGNEKKKLTEQQKQYIYSRGLTNETIKKFKLVGMDDSVGIPYFKRGKLTGIKKRMLKGSVKNLSATGSKFYFFNFDNTTTDQMLIVTEGEWDAMIVDQCGYTNVVSVGCGASSVATLFDNAEEDIKQYQEIILFTDNDERGQAMDKAFIDKFGSKISTVDKSLYDGCKDANALFLKHGEAAITKVIQSGKASFDGEWDLEQEPYKKLDPKDSKFILTHIDTLDNAINCIQSKMVTLITGRSNAGKSTFVNQVISSAIGQDFKVYLALGEGDKTKVMNKFYMGLVGGNREYYDLHKFGLKDIKEPKPHVLKALQRWHKGKLKLWVKALSKHKTDAEMFDMLEYKIRTERYDMVVLDNQMSLITVKNSADKLEAQATFVQNCHNLAVATNCAVILVLHPNKTYKKGEEMDFEQIAGTSDIANKADAIINVIRVSDDQVKGGITSKLQVLKNRDYPDLPVIDCTFDFETHTFAEVSNGKVKKKSDLRWKKYLPTEVSINDGQELHEQYLKAKGEV